MIWGFEYEASSFFFFFFFFDMLRLILRFLLRSFSKAMGCFFGCFRFKDDRRLPTSSHLAADHRLRSKPAVIFFILSFFHEIASKCELFLLGFLILLISVLGIRFFVVGFSKAGIFGISESFVFFVFIWRYLSCVPAFRFFEIFFRLLTFCVFFIGNEESSRNERVKVGMGSHMDDKALKDEVLFNFYLSMK